MLPILILALFVCSADAGTSFIRWGRTTCPAGTVVLHKGYMAGAHYNQGGQGSNFLCVHDSPKFVRPVAGRQDIASYIWGVEMEWGAANFPIGNGGFLPDNSPGGMANQDVPCVRCYVADATDSFMMSGRPDCGSSGYDLQYSGFVVAQFWSGRMRSEYTCIDEAPEGRIGGTANDDQGVIYPVQVGCGSLPCNPYVDGYELPCAVCTY